MKRVCGAVASLVCGVAIATAANATLVGDQVSATELYPDTSTSLGTTGPLTITSGGNDFGTVGQSEVDIVVGGTTIDFTAVYAYTPQMGTFDGFDIKDLNPSTTITGVSLASGFLPAGDLTFGPHDVFVNLSGVPLNPAAPIVVDVTSASGVPEPQTWALMLIGFGGLGATMRGTRPQRTTA